MATAVNELEEEQRAAQIELTKRRLAYAESEMKEAMQLQEFNRLITKTTNDLVDALDNARSAFIANGDWQSYWRRMLEAKEKYTRDLYEIAGI
jgi:hypothetical protein